jgi:hypothetical protein
MARPGIENSSIRLAGVLRRRSWRRWASITSWWRRGLLRQSGLLFLPFFYQARPTKYTKFMLCETSVPWQYIEEMESPVSSLGKGLASILEKRD